LARSQNVALPARVAVAFWLGIASCMLSTAVATWAFVDSRHERHRVAARTAQLEREIGAGASAPTLARAVACALAEQRALKVGYDGEPGERLDDFTCVGRFAAGTDSASLEDFSFRYSSTTFNVSTCFKRGAIWYVSDMRTGACPTGVPVAGPAASAGALPGGPASAAGKQPN